MRTIGFVLALAVFLSSPLMAAAVDLGRGVTLDWDPQKGTIGAQGGLFAADLDKPDAWVPVIGPVSSKEQSLEFSGEANQLDLAVTASFTPLAPDAVETVLTLKDTTGRDRGAAIRLVVPLSADGLTWWDSLDTSRAVGADTLYRAVRGIRAFPSLPYEPETPIAGAGQFSPWFFGCVTRGNVGLAIGRRPDKPSVSRFAYDSGVGALTAECEAGLSAAYRYPQQVTFHLVLFSFDGTLGMRGALARYYELFPEAFRKRAQQQGIWLPFGSMRNMKDANEFGIQFHESGKDAAFSRALGADQLVYMFPSAFHATARQAPEGASLDELIDLAEVHYNAYGGKGRQRVRNSVAYNADGEPIISPYPGGITGSPNMDPDLPLSEFSDAVIARYMEAGSTTGVYYDGLAGGINYRREHLTVADCPPIYDAAARKVGLLNLFTSIEWAEKVARDVGERGGLTMVNNSAMDDYSWYVYVMDVVGAETSLHIPLETLAYCRSVCYQKPFCTLLKGDFDRYARADVETYMKRLVAFGHMPGMFDITPSRSNPGSSYWNHPEWYNRDRSLFRKYIPLARELAAAGWEPVTWVEADGGVTLQRFGHLDKGHLFIAVLNDTTAAYEGTLVLAAERLGLQQDPLEYHEEVRHERLVARRDGNHVLIPLSVPASDLAVVRIARPRHMARARMQRAVEIIEARQTYAREIAKQEHFTWWRPLERGYAIDHTVAFDGAASMRCEGGDKPSGATQTIPRVAFDPAALIVTAHARFEGVSAEDRAKCVVEVVIRGRETGEDNFTIPFSGTGEWLEASQRLITEYPIWSVDIALKYGGAAGKVWFDEVALGVENSGINRLRYAGFEDGVLPPDTEQQATRQLEAIRQAITAAEASAEAQAALSHIEQAREPLATLEELVSVKKLASAADRIQRDACDVEQLLDLATCHVTGTGPLQVDLDGAPVPGGAVRASFHLPGTALQEPQFKLSAEQCRVEDGNTIRIPPELPVGQSIALQAQITGKWQGQLVRLHSRQQASIVGPYTATLRLAGISQDNHSYSFELITTNRTADALTLTLATQRLDNTTTDLPNTIALAPRRIETIPFTLTFGPEAHVGPVKFAVMVGGTAQEPVVLSQEFTFLGNEPNLVRNAGFEQTADDKAQHWAAYGEHGYSIDRETKLSGEAAIRASLDAGGIAGALQGLALNQQVRSPVIIRGFSRGENVRGAQYSLYADAYYQSKGAAHGRRAVFSQGTHDWEYAEALIEPLEPIKSIALYCLLRYRPGKVWFDDVWVVEDPSRKHNLLATEQATVTTDSNAGTQYNPGPLTDGRGYPDEATLHWAELAWASKDTPGEHWIEMSFGQPTQVGRVHIFWAPEKGFLCTSRRYDIEALVADQWQKLVEVEQAEERRLNVHRFEPVTVERLRILQHSGGGPAFRPNIMWVAEVEAFAD